MTPAQQNFLDSLRRYIVSRFDRLEAKLDAALAAKEVTSEAGATISSSVSSGSGSGAGKSGPVASTINKKGGR